MKWLAISLAMLAVAGASGCWRPYYGHNYAPPAYQQAPVYQQPQPVMQAAPVMQAPVMQPQQVCPPQPCCQPCY